MKNKKIILSSILSGVIAVGSTTVIVSCGSDGDPPEKAKSPDQGTGNPSLGGNPSQQGSRSNLLKIANWNLKNLNGSDYAKNTAAAKIINDAGLSLVGVEEVDSAAALYKIASQLNYVQGKQSWKVVSSDLSYKATGDNNVTRMSGISAQEYYGFIYDSDALMPKAFNNNKIGDLYNNPFKENKYLKDARDNHSVASITNIKSAYVRPPFAASFEAKATHKDFTAVIAHLDSPGAGSRTHAGEAAQKNSSAHTGATFEYSPKVSTNDALSAAYGGGIGSQEAWEAEEISNVMTYFDNINGDDNDMIFMGDTNIKNTSTGNPFQSTIDAGYTQAFDPASDDSKTSIGSSGYVNPYDRIYLKTPLAIGQHARRYDMNNAFSSAGVDARSLHIYNTPSFKDISDKISDHALVIQNLDMSQSENGKSSGTVKVQDPRNIDINNASYFDLRTVAGLSSQAAYKVLYYRKYVGNIDTEEKLTKVLQYYSTSRQQWRGGATYSERGANVHFDYSHTYDQSKASEEIVDQSSYITRTTQLTFDKIHVNTDDYATLKKAIDNGLLSAKTLSKIAELRNQNTAITSLDQIGIDSTNPGQELYQGVYDLSGTPTAISNPLDVNVSSFDELLQAIGPNSSYRLHEYDVAAIIAYRQQAEKVDDKTELERILGSYAANKIGDILTYSSAVSTATNKVEADLNAKIDIFSADNAKFTKYMGSTIGGLIWENLLNKAKASVLNGQTGNVQVNFSINKTELFNGIRNPQYFELQFGQIFNIPSTQGSMTINIAAPVDPSNGYTVSDLITHAQSSADLTTFLKQFPGLAGGGSSGIGEMSKTQFGYLVTALSGMDPTAANDFDAIVAAAQVVHPYQPGSVKKYDILKTHLH